MKQCYKAKKVFVYCIAAGLVVLCCCSHLVGDDYMEWTGNFSDISLTAISSQSGQPSGSSTITLRTSGNAAISADTTTTAQLSITSDALVTEYKLTFDDAGGTTGVDTPDWQQYDVFLTNGNEGDVTYVADDNEVDVTLWVRTSNPAGRIADAGDYTAVQTITASWVGP